MPTFLGVKLTSTCYQLSHLPSLLSKPFSRNKVIFTYTYIFSLSHYKPNTDLFCVKTRTQTKYSRFNIKKFWARDDSGIKYLACELKTRVPAVIPNIW